MKKNLLLCSMFLTSFLVCESEEFVPQRFTWTYSVQALDTSDMTDFAKFNSQLNDLIVDIHRGQSSNMYEQTLNFLKELQEAIVAGVNLFSSVVTTQESAAEMIVEETEKVAEETDAVADSAMNQDEQTEDVIANVSEETDAVVSVNPALNISVMCTLLNQQDLELWNSAKSTLQALADNMNNNVCTPDEIIATLNNVYDILIQLEGSNLSLTSANIN